VASTGIENTNYIIFEYQIDQSFLI